MRWNRGLVLSRAVRRLINDNIWSMYRFGLISVKCYAHGRYFSWKTNWLRWTHHAIFEQKYPILRRCAAKRIRRICTFLIYSYGAPRDMTPLQMVPWISSISRYNSSSVQLCRKKAKISKRFRPQYFKSGKLDIRRVVILVRDFPEQHCTKNENRRKNAKKLNNVYPNIYSPV